MPDEPVCWIYKDWFEMLPPAAKLDIATLMESTQSFIEAYGQETYNRTLLNLAVHGKPQATLVEVHQTDTPLQYCTACCAVRTSAT